MAARRRVCLVGSGTWFLSGISYYTYFLAESLANQQDVSVILMRKLIPRRLYPGRDRVGTDLTSLSTEQICPTLNGVDWFGVPSIFRAVRFFLRQDADVLILEWWTASVFVWYAVLVAAARARGIKVVLELHEEIDTGEASLPVIGSRLRWLLRQLCRGADAYVVHSEWDRSRLASSLSLPIGKIAVIRHGPYPMAASTDSAPPLRAPERTDKRETRLLFFGTIRPYKGLEILAEAFEQLPRKNKAWKLAVVGESWEGWTLPLELIDKSQHRDDINLVNRYISDAEVPDVFASADIVVLPYLRSSASGPLHLAMTEGLPVIVSAVGGLTEAVRGYPGATVVEPGDAAALAEAIVRVAELPPERYSNPHSWSDVAAEFGTLIEGLL